MFNWVLDTSFYHSIIYHGINVRVIISLNNFFGHCNEASGYSRFCGRLGNIPMHQSSDYRCISPLLIAQ